MADYFMREAICLYSGSQICGELPVVRIIQYQKHFIMVILTPKHRCYVAFIYRENHNALIASQDSQCILFGFRGVLFWGFRMP